MYQLNIEISPNWSFAAFSRQGTVFFIEIFPYSKRMMSSISRSLKTSAVCVAFWSCRAPLALVARKELLSCRDRPDMFCDGMVAWSSQFPQVFHWMLSTSGSFFIFLITLKTRCQDFFPLMSQLCGFKSWWKLSGNLEAQYLFHPNRFSTASQLRFANPRLRGLWNSQLKPWHFAREVSHPKSIPWPVAFHIFLDVYVQYQYIFFWNWPGFQDISSIKT